MTIYAAPGATVEATVQGFPTGLAGTARYRVLDNAGATTSGPTTTGISEYPSGSGFYTVSFTAPTTAGAYSILWDTGTLGPTTSAAEDLIVSYSSPTAAAPSASDLCTVADVRTILEIASADTTRDTLIQDRITAASAMIKSYTEREFVAVASTTRRFAVPVTARVFDLAPFDLRSASAVSLHPETSSPVTLTANTDYMLAPVQPRFSVYTHLRFSSKQSLTGSQFARDFGLAYLDITATWGFASVPQEARDACIDCVIAWLRRDLSAVSYDGISVDGGMLGERPSSAFTIPLSARQKLDPFRRSIPGV